MSTFWYGFIIGALGIIVAEMVTVVGLAIVAASRRKPESKPVQPNNVQPFKLVKEEPE